MNQIPYGWIIVGYVGAVLGSFYGLNVLADLLGEKCPRLINRKWKRILWLLSCPMLVPIPAFFCLLAFSSIAREFKEFLSWGEDENTSRQEDGEQAEDKGHPGNDCTTKKPESKGRTE